jgi:antitoxin CcdA
MRMDKTQSKKKPVNLLVDTDLLEDARKADLNLSATFDRAVRRELAKRWTEENREAIKAYNEQLEREGVWNEEHRTW